MQYAASHRCQNRQNIFERSTRAASENRDIAGVGAVTAAGDGAFHKHRAARFDERAESDDFTIIGGAHFQPHLPRAHHLQKAIFALGHGRTGGRRWQAGDD